MQAEAGAGCGGRGGTPPGNATTMAQKLSLAEEATERAAPTLTPAGGGGSRPAVASVPQAIARPPPAVQAPGRASPGGGFHQPHSPHAQHSPRPYGYGGSPVGGAGGATAYLQQSPPPAGRWEPVPFGGSTPPGPRSPGPDGPGSWRQSPVGSPSSPAFAEGARARASSAGSGWGSPGAEPAFGSSPSDFGTSPGRRRLNLMPRTRPRNSSEPEQPRSGVFGEALPREEVLNSWKISGSSRKLGNSPGAGRAGVPAPATLKLHGEPPLAPAELANPFQGLEVEADC